MEGLLRRAPVTIVWRFRSNIHEPHPAVDEPRENGARPSYRRPPAVGRRSSNPPRFWSHQVLKLAALGKPPGGGAASSMAKATYRAVSGSRRTFSHRSRIAGSA